MYRKNLIISLLLFLSLLCSHAVAATYYIAPDGNNHTGDGSTTNPWYSLSYACSQITTYGDTIYINAGNYTDNSQCILALGVNIEGSGKATTIITSSYSGWYLKAKSSSTTNGNHNISGFTLNGNNRALNSGMHFENRNTIIIHDCDFMNIEDRALEFLGAPYIAYNVPSTWMSNLQLYNCNFTSCSKHNQGWDYNGAIHMRALKNSSIFNINVNEASGTGQCLRGVCGFLRNVKIYNSSFTGGVGRLLNIELWNMMEGSEIYNNTFTNGMLSFAAMDVIKGYATPSCKFYGNVHNTHGYNEFAVSDWEIYKNFFIGSISEQACGVGIWQTDNEWQKGSSNNLVIRNNVFYNSKSAAIVIDDNSNPFDLDNIRIYNNVIDGVKPSGWGPFGIIFKNTLGGNSWTNFKVKNNLFMNIPGTGVTAMTGGNRNAIMSPQVNYNMFYNVTSNIDLSETNDPVISNNRIDTPDLNYSENRFQYYFPSGQSSNLVDEGIDVGFSYFGLSPEIGAFEYDDNSVFNLASPTGLKILCINGLCD